MSLQNPEMLLLTLTVLTLLSLFVTLVYAVGIVWRVERELDISYKFFAWAIFFLLLSEMFDLIPFSQMGIGGIVAIRATHLLAAFFLFLGVFFMRDLIRRMDGEK